MVMPSVLPPVNYRDQRIQLHRDVANELASCSRAMQPAVNTTASPAAANLLDSRPRSTRSRRRLKPSRWLAALVRGLTRSNAASPTRRPEAVGISGVKNAPPSRKPVKTALQRLQVVAKSFDPFFARVINQKTVSPGFRLATGPRPRILNPKQTTPIDETADRNITPRSNSNRLGKVAALLAAFPEMFERHGGVVTAVDRHCSPPSLTPGCPN